MVETGTRKCPKCKKDVSLADDAKEVERRVGEGFLILHLECPACGNEFDTAIDSD